MKQRPVDELAEAILRLGKGLGTLAVLAAAIPLAGIILYFAAFWAWNNFSIIIRCIALLALVIPVVIVEERMRR